MVNHRYISVSRHAGRGFTLIEALVAILVLSIGLLGVAGMQLKALQSAHAGYQRSIASLAAQDAQERLWATLAETYPNCPNSSEYGPKMNFQGDTWYENWSSFLPGLVQDPIIQDGCVFYINIIWDESRFGDAKESFSYTVRLPGGA